MLVKLTTTLKSKNIVDEIFYFPKKKFSFEKQNFRFLYFVVDVKFVFVIINFCQIINLLHTHKKTNYKLYLENFYHKWDRDYLKKTYTNFIKFGSFFKNNFGDFRSQYYERNISVQKGLNYPLYIILCKTNLDYNSVV
jgi:hypothetical protein